MWAYREEEKEKKRERTSSNCCSRPPIDMRSVCVCVCVCVINCVRLLICAIDRIRQQAFPASKPISWSYTRGGLKQSTISIARALSISERHFRLGVHSLLVCLIVPRPPMRFSPSPSLSRKPTIGDVRVSSLVRRGRKSKYPLMWEAIRFMPTSLSM